MKIVESGEKFIPLFTDIDLTFEDSLDDIKKGEKLILLKELGLCPCGCGCRIKYCFFPKWGVFGFYPGKVNKP